MIFADTSALFALFNPNDEFHNSAKEWFKNQRPKLVLTDYIVDELLALAISRTNKEFALTISKRIRDLAGIKKIAEEDFYKAWEIFDRYQDKDWSLTDCTSYVFMERSGIKKAFAFDPHFDQFGSVLRVPIL
ncbi:MAG TPA: type II toxin-antitoxin system VapC family toxin [Candidatus Wunengus sp. YC60]|uniref:type II toxin-antitoxin system VapC family toxin n=1 Tax=Candidatus Wunengus sp. YC60 TaxID=3367697 RepID=UPI0040280E47